VSEIIFVFLVSCKINVRYWKRKILKVLGILINMAKKEVGVQIAIILMLIGFFYWLAITDFFIRFSQVNAIIQAYKVYFIIFAFALGLIPISNLILQMISKDEKEYNDKTYYAILNGISHLIFSSLIILILAVVFAYLWIYSLVLISAVWLSFIISATIIFTIHYLLWDFLEKKFKLKPFGFFSYARKLNQSHPSIVS